MAHIGNGHEQAPAFFTAHFGRLTIHRIIEISGVFAIDRHKSEVGQIDALQGVFRANFVGQSFDKLQALGRELMGDAEFANRNFNLHPRIIDLAQDLFDASNRLTIKTGGFGEFHHHHLAHVGRTRGPFGDDHILAVTFVFGRHKPDTVFL